jgi:hypothetical protein
MISMGHESAVILPHDVQMDAELWRVSGGYGFHPAHNSEGSARPEFSVRIKRFIETSLVYKPNTVCTKRSLAIIIGEKRRPVKRDSFVGLELINELSIAWACTLLRFGFRGFTQDKVMDLLKSESVWLLAKFEHKLHPRHAIFCPVLNIWENQKWWRVVRDNDLDELGLSVVPVIHQFRSDVCEGCLPK